MARQLAGLAKTDGDLDDEDCLSQEGYQGEEVVTQNADSGRRQK